MVSPYDSLVERVATHRFGVEVELRKNYTTVKIPIELASKLDNLVSGQGYHSRAEVVNDAIRRFIDERKQLDEKLVKEVSQVPLIRTS